MTIFDEVQAECQRRDETEGVHNYLPSEWLAVLMEELGEAAKARNAVWSGHVTQWLTYRQELIHIAAVAIAAAESLDRTDVIKT